MLDRRALLALSTPLPIGGFLARLDIPDPRIHPLNVGDIKLFGASPDASVLVGFKGRDRIAFVDAETSEEISVSDEVDEIAGLDEESVAWSPDGTQFAFCLKAWTLLRDSDIFVVDIVTGEVENITPEGTEQEAAPLTEDTDDKIDTNPVWLDDDTLLFARHERIYADDYSTELVTMQVSTREVTSFVDLSAHNINYVTSPIRRLSGGDVVFSVGYHNADIRRGVVRVSTDSEVESLYPGELETSQLWDVNDTHMFTVDAETFEHWYLPLDTSEEAIPLWDQFPIPTEQSIRSAPVLGPKRDTLAVVLERESGALSVHVFEGNENRQLAALAGVFERQRCHWVGDWILITGSPKSWLVPID